MAKSREEAELVQSLKQQLTNCAGWQGDELAKHRTEALNYYFQRLRGDELPGRSKLVSGDESAMVEANLAQMMDAFTSSRVVDFKPLGMLDKQQALIESDTVTYFVMEVNNGWMALSSAIKDALQMRNGVVKAWIETRREVRYETYSKVKDREVVAELLSRPGMECTLTKKWKPGDGLLEMRCTRTVKRFRFEAIPLENFLYPKDYDSHDLQRIPFCAERHIDTRSEMIALGFEESRVNKLKPMRQRVALEGAARNPQSVVGFTGRPIDKSQELVEWYEIYHLHDKDGDGIAERRRVCLAWEGELLSDVPVNIVPYAVGVVLVNQHRLTGIGMHDKLKQVQDKRTMLARAVGDNINATTKNRTASLDGTVNPEDLADGRVNGNIRVDRRKVADVRQAIMAFTVPDTSANILANDDAAKRERAELGGAALDMAAGNMQLNERMGSEGVDRVYSVMEQLAALMTRNVANTLIRNAWLLAHATLREGWNEPTPIELNGEFLEAVPKKWRERLCVNVKPGMSPGERSRLQNALRQMLQWQVELAREGMDEVLVYLEGFYKALMDWARVAEVPNPEQYYLNPAGEVSKQALAAKQKAAKQMQEQKQMLMRQAVGLEQLRTAVEKYAGDADRQFKYFNAVLGAEVEEAKIVGNATTELIKAKEQGRAKAGAGGARSTRTGSAKARRRGTATPAKKRAAK